MDVNMELKRSISESTIAF